MKLIECYIENFGKLCKEKFTFSEGFNCICQDNGEGKTTLSVFIKVMLYGMSDTKKTSLYENERKRYLPWQGGVCGGYMIFSAGGKKYRIERTFASKAADDTYALYDVGSGRACDDFSESLGEELFGIDADGFERTVFLSERNLPTKSENKSISAKLSDLVGTDGDIGVMDEAMKVLEDQRKFYQKRGGGGKISDIKSRITDTELHLAEMSKIENEIAEADVKIEKISSEMNALGEEAKQLLSKRGEALLLRSQADSAERYKRLQAELDAYVRRKDELIEFFGGEVPTYEETDRASLSYLRARQLTEAADTDGENDAEYAALAAFFEGRVDKSHSMAKIRAAKERLCSKRSAADDPRRIRYEELFKNRVPEKSEVDAIIEAHTVKSPGKAQLLAYIVLTALLVAGIACALLFSPLFYILSITSAVLAIVVFLLPKRAGATDKFFLSVYGSIPRKSDRISLLLEMRSLLSDEGPTLSDTEDEQLLYSFVKSFGVSCDDVIAQADELLSRYDRYEKLTLAKSYRRESRKAELEEAERFADESRKFLSRFRISGDDPFAEIRSALSEYTELTAKIVAFRGQLENRSLPLDDNTSKPCESIEELDAKRQVLDERRGELERQLGAMMKKRGEDETALLEKDALTAQRAELLENLKEAEDSLKTLLMTQKYLTIAKDSITSKYLGKTKESFEKYTELIGGDGGDFSMDTSFGVTRLDAGATRVQDAYSRGTRELYGLASRLALTDSLYEGEKPFIVLDDPFTAFDDGKTRRALELLKKLSEKRQIIYFTCSESRAI